MNTIIRIIIGIFIILVLVASMLFTNAPPPKSEDILQEPEQQRVPDTDKEPQAPNAPPPAVDTPIIPSVVPKITHLYKTRTDGRTWSAKWNMATQRTLKSGQRDPFDSEFIARGNGTVSILGTGIAQLTGSSPRMYVYDSLKKKKWGNVEVTVYGKRISETNKRSSQGIVIGARSEHQDATNAAPCLGKTYYARLLYDGRAGFQKEIVHEKLYSDNMPNESNKVDWGTSDGSMPKNTWIGMKYIVRTNANKSVTLTMYIDLTDGKSGGTWKKVAEYVDTGAWPYKESSLDIDQLCGYPGTTVFSSPATSVFIRNDDVSKAEYKNFSIREI